MLPDLQQRKPNQKKTQSTTVEEACRGIPTLRTRTQTRSRFGARRMRSHNIRKNYPRINYMSQHNHPKKQEMEISWSTGLIGPMHYKALTKHLLRTSQYISDYTYKCWSEKKKSVYNNFLSSFLFCTNPKRNKMAEAVDAKTTLRQWCHFKGIENGDGRADQYHAIPSYLLICGRANEIDFLR